MTFSVIVAWRGAAEPLRRCLRALEGQGADQIVVASTAGAQFSDGLTAEFPRVEWLEPFDVSDLPELYWQALPAMTGDVVATLEALSTPEPGWVERLREAHERRPGTFSCGGSVVPPTGSGLDRGWYWSEFAAYSPGRRSEATNDLTDANVSYKRRLLEESVANADRRVWGWRLRRESKTLSYFEPAAQIAYPNPHSAVEALRERYAAGRRHAAVRRAGVPVALAALGLPIVLTWRSLRSAAAAGAGGACLPTLPWLFSLHLSWACGEAVGAFSVG